MIINIMYILFEIVQQLNKKVVQHSYFSNTIDKVLFYC